MRRCDYAPLDQSLAADLQRGADSISGNQYNADSVFPQINPGKNHSQLPASFRALLYRRVPEMALSAGEDRSKFSYRPRKQALMCKLVQINFKNLVTTLVIDIDIDNQDSLIAWSHKGLPQPNCIVSNHDNNKCHYLYFLAAPVSKSIDSRTHPLRYLAAIQRAYNTLLGGDEGNVNLVCKSPLSELNHLIYGHDHEFLLGELARSCAEILKEKKTYARHDRGLGRNVTLFDDLRYWAYPRVDEFRSSGSLLGWWSAVADKADDINATFAQPLDSSEVGHTVKSVAEWTWLRYEKGTGKGSVRRGAMRLDEAGVELSLSEKQSMAAEYTNQIRKDANREKIIDAIGVLTGQGRPLRGDFLISTTFPVSHLNLVSIVYPV